MRYLLTLAAAVLLAAGVVGVVLGESDDSPGLQLLGGLLVIGAIGIGVRVFRVLR
ncbi:hypothetical protein [Micromonospora sp. HUAS LYJ1]|uniref:hypothetical protein n=1 Tax=Micromonospora sp. HUAS LYJ1 TaxID=3061626 RepID=UPI002673DF72|nr:hypothetical protein [Micromonospora sp. HUAS LYJ1]WKU06016.1 hypothetical protein Q2K16_02745 [Micromonospora sp. HUAS LYJ1]